MASASNRTALAVRSLPGGPAPGGPGKPPAISAAALRQTFFSKEIPLTELWRSYYGRALDMGRIEQAIRGAEVGQMRPLTDLCTETLDRDPHLASLAQKRFGSLSALDWDLEPATGAGIKPDLAQQYASVVREQINKVPAFRQRIFDLAWGLFDGRSSLENMWRGPRVGPVRWEIEALGWIHPRRISLGPEREFRIVDGLYSTSYFPAIGEALRDWPFKFIEFKPRLFREYPEREGLGVRALYWSFFKRFGQRERMILTELFGKPWRIIEPDADAPEPAQKEDYDAVDSQIAALGGANVARMPRGFKLNVQKPGEGSGDVHRDIIQDANAELSKLFLGQTMTTDAGKGDGLGSHQADVHQDEQLLILKRDAWAISESIEDGLVDAIITLNFGEAALSHAPRFNLKADPALDTSKETDRLDKALRAGVPVALDQVYEVTGYRKPREDEAVLKLTLAAGETSPRPMVVYPAGEEPDSGAIPGKPASPDVQTGTAPPPADPNEPEQNPATEQNAPPIQPTIAESISVTRHAEIADMLLATIHEHDHVSFSKAPSTVNGSPETIVDKAIRECSRLTAQWATTMANAVEGAGNGNAILRKLNLTAASLDLAPFARIVERRLLHGLMLGALDSSFEADTDHAVTPEKFAAPVLPGASEPAFAAKPYDAALRWFKAKKVVDRATFEQLSARAKQRGFTVARMASQDMLQATHAELYKQISEGADLRTFKQFAKERLESAGWTPANSSHVENIFRTNVMNAYGAGRHAEMTQPAVLKARPYWQILGVGDDRTRPAHKHVLGWALRADDPIWKTAYPPFGYMCRCRVRSLSETLVHKLGLTVRSGTDLVNLPDKGFTSGTNALLGG